MLLNWFSPEAISGIMFNLEMRRSCFVEVDRNLVVPPNWGDVVQFLNADEAVSVCRSSIHVFVVSSDLWLFVKPALLDLVFVRARFWLPLFVNHDFTGYRHSRLLHKLSFAPVHSVLFWITPFYILYVLFRWSR